MTSIDININSEFNRLFIDETFKYKLVDNEQETPSLKKKLHKQFGWNGLSPVVENKSVYAEEEHIDLLKSHEEKSYLNSVKQRIRFEKLLKERVARERKLIYEIYSVKSLVFDEIKRQQLIDIDFQIIEAKSKLNERNSTCALILSNLEELIQILTLKTSKKKSKNNGFKKLAQKEEEISNNIKNGATKNKEKAKSTRLISIQTAVFSRFGK